jgi:hypothetical protein
LIPIEVLVDGLSARAQQLAQELFPGGRLDGVEWRVGSLAGEPGQSLAVRVRGTNAGTWADFAAGADRLSGSAGDALDLVAQVLFRGDKTEAIKWARHWLGYGGTDPEALKITRRAVETRAVGPDPEAEAAKRRDMALRVYLSGRQSIAGTPVEGYLIGRGLDLRVLGRQPGALRFHPELWCDETGGALPGMVALIVDGAGKPMAVHRTYLQVHPDGRVTKAALETPKKVLGSYRGGSIRLWRGASGKPVDKAKEPETWALTEGIEDALTVAIAKPEWRVVAGISLSNLANIPIAPCCDTLVVCADNDWGNDSAARGLTRALQALRPKVRRLRIVRSSVGKDLNDLLNAGEPRSRATL